MWVRSEYAGELSVLATWLCALAPWAVTVGRVQQLETTVWIFWYHPRRFLFLPSVELEGGPPSWVWEFTNTPLYGGDSYMGLLWIAGTLVFLAAFGYSLLYYFREEEVEDSRLDPVRVLGGLLLVSGAILALVFGALVQNHPGTTVPLGVLLQVVFGVVLLQTERVETTGATEGAESADE